MFTRYWNPYLAISLAGVLAALYFGITGTVWAVTGEFTRFGGHLLQVVGIDTSGWAYFQLVSMNGTPLTRTDGWIVIGMLGGALMTVLLSRSFKIRMPQQKRRLVQGFIGGIIAGFGARLALGCNLAAFFTGVPQFSFHAWIFMFATAVGTYLGVKVVNTRWWRGTPNLRQVTSTKKALATAGTTKTNLTNNNSHPTTTITHTTIQPNTDSRTSQSRTPQSRSIQPILGTVVALILTALAVFYFATARPMLGVALLAGVGFGVLIERGQICFTSAFRDLWISGRAVMTKAIAVGMAVSVVLTFLFLLTGSTALIKVAAPGTLVGGLLFGLGIVLAGGCETGMMYRMMEGQVLFLVVGVGNVLGATLLAYGWDHLGIAALLVAGWQPINLISSWGPAWALIGTLAMLGIWYALAHWWEKQYRYGRGLKLGGGKKSETPQAKEVYS